MAVGLRTCRVAGAVDGKWNERKPTEEFRFPSIPFLGCRGSAGRIPFLHRQQVCHSPRSGSSPSFLPSLFLREGRELELGRCRVEVFVCIKDHAVSEERLTRLARKRHRQTTDLSHAGAVMVSPSFDLEHLSASFGNECPQNCEFAMQLFFYGQCSKNYSFFTIFFLFIFR